ncbi:ATP-binding cassette domain-containing protein [Corynebacterium pacaense]|uniref:ATP-binding cassette domain-containing protein n=1 Tax=Corynebacterium pacaense TaxID=1816684 RepID=UPI0009BC41FA|nr:ATP-binding cassette domain-containing protein [Corynebacterium pacaense]
MLNVDSISVGYGRTGVVHGVSFSTGDSGVTAILGHNGAGKSTTLRAIVGLLAPTAGTITFKGRDITRLAPHKRVALGMAYVPQGQQSFEQLTAKENLQVVADLQPGRSQELIDEAVARFPALEPVLARQAGLLSGGQRQQLAIARALITKPELLILDEPTEGIQPSVVTEIQRTIASLAAEGISVLLVEQHVDFALSVASRYLVLSVGEVIERGRGGVEAGVTEMEKVKRALAI